MLRHFSVFLLILVAIVGCKDKAADNYAKCVQADVQGLTLDAWTACRDAVHDDPTSKSGGAAATKLVELKPKFDVWKAADDARQAKEAEAQKVANAARVKALRLRVQRKYFSEDPDPTCTGKGLPAYHWEYAGGTFGEDATVAESDGCKALFDFNGQNTDFCCPQSP